MRVNARLTSADLPSDLTLPPDELPPPPVFLFAAMTDTVDSLRHEPKEGACRLVACRDTSIRNREEILQFIFEKITLSDDVARCEM